jgi:hypothetical protein
LRSFRRCFPAAKFRRGSLITRDDLTEGQIHFSQILFSGPVIARAGRRRGGGAVRVFAKMSARGEVVQQVATPICTPLPRASEVDNAKALEAQAQVAAHHAHAAHEAGTAANLDELRARVQLAGAAAGADRGAKQQEKDLILLKREIGIDPGQKIALTDPAPYSELAAQTPEEGARHRLQEPPGLPESAEPGSGIQGHCTRPIAASGCPR